MGLKWVMPARSSTLTSLHLVWPSGKSPPQSSLVPANRSTRLFLVPLSSTKKTCYLSLTRWRLYCVGLKIQCTRCLAKGYGLRGRRGQRGLADNGLLILWTYCAMLITSLLLFSCRPYCFNLVNVIMSWVNSQIKCCGLA